jgi:hypothetical protein
MTGVFCPGLTSPSLRGMKEPAGTSQNNADGEGNAAVRRLSRHAEHCAEHAAPLAALPCCAQCLPAFAALPSCTPWLPLLGLGLTRVADDHEAPVQRLVHRHKDEILGKQVNILRQEAARQATNEDK